MIPTIYNCFRQKSVYLGLPKNSFTVNTGVLTAVLAGQKLQEVQNLIITDSCIALHSRA